MKSDTWVGVLGLGLLMAGLVAGCKTPDWPWTPDPIPIPTPTPTPTPEPYAQDDLDLSTVRWFGANYSKAKVATRIRSAWTNGKNVYTDYEPYGGAGWPVMFQDSPKPCNAIICLFYRNAEGQVVGGKFDWWRVGGAKIKGLENVESGYGGHTGLATGADCWEMIVSTDGKLRSNVKKVEWK